MPVFRADLDAAEIARQIEQRHKMESRRVEFRASKDDVSMGIGDVAMSTVGQQSLLPSVSDPSMWMFGCAAGKEEELVYQIMNKCIAYAKQGKPLGITAAVAAQTKGKIFIESFSEPAVLDAVQGIRNLLTYSKRLVPITDMTTVMNVVRKKKPGTSIYFTDLVCVTIHIANLSRLLSIFSERERMGKDDPWALQRRPGPCA
jgi:transcription elongation factor SPT5